MTIRELLEKPRPWNIEVRFGKNEYDSQILVEGESLEESYRVKVEAAWDEKPTFTVWVYRNDKADDGCSIGYPAKITVESHFTGILKGEATIGDSEKV